MNISVALCSYNGEKFIGEQIQSIAAQTIRPFELVICDDGSTDRTIEIIQSFKNTLPFKVKLYVNETGLGASLNFARCIELCRGDYVALSDQDDIWHKNKIEVLMEKMEKAEKVLGANTPILIHSDLEVVDCDCKKIAHSFFSWQNLKHSKNGLPTLLVQNFVTGCACIVNHALIKSSLPIPHNAIMHDWWLALVASSIGYVGFVNQCTVKYRQHGNNTVGAKRFLSFQSLCKSLKWNDLNRQFSYTIRQSTALEQHLETKGILVPTVLKKYNEVVNSPNTLKMLSVVLLNNIYKQGVLRNIWLLFLLGVGKYKRYL